MTETPVARAITGPLPHGRRIHRLHLPGCGDCRPIALASASIRSGSRSDASSSFSARFASANASRCDRNVLDLVTVLDGAEVLTHIHHHQRKQHGQRDGKQPSSRAAARGSAIFHQPRVIDHFAQNRSPAHPACICVPAAQHRRFRQLCGNVAAQIDITSLQDGQTGCRLRETAWRESRNLRVAPLLPFRPLRFDTSHGRDQLLDDDSRMHVVTHVLPQHPAVL